MPKTALLRLAASGLLLLACLVNHALPRMETPRLRVVPIERLSSQIGTWTCTQELPIEPKVRALLPDAVFLSRLYRDERGRTAQLFLETSEDAQMFHSPTQCMPAQNWNILNTRRVDVSSGSRLTAAMGNSSQPTSDSRETPGVAATEMDMQDAGQQNMLLLYWYTTERQLDKWQALKTKLLSGRPQTRLFARILVPASEDFTPAAQTAQDFAQSLLPALAELENR